MNLLIVTYWYHWAGKTINSIQITLLMEVKGGVKLFKICWHCRSNYIEENEEICVPCAVWFTDENEYSDNLENEHILEEYGDNEFLNDLGASFVTRDE